MHFGRGGERGSLFVNIRLTTRGQNPDGKEKERHCYMDNTPLTGAARGFGLVPAVHIAVC